MYWLKSGEEELIAVQPMIQDEYFVDNHRQSEIVL